MSNFILLLKNLYAYCTDFIINLANLSNLSYYEINFIIFIVFFPLSLLISIVIFLKQKYRLQELKKRQLMTSNIENNSNNKIKNDVINETPNKSIKSCLINNFKKVLENPGIIIFISAIIALLNTEEYFPYSLSFICLIDLASVIYTLSRKKWLIATAFAVLYMSFLLFWFIMIAFSEEIKTQIAIGDKQFYKDEIKKTTNLDIPDNLNLIAKLDTIYYVGIENEYDAECIYQGPKNSIISLEEKIQANTSFTKENSLPNSCPSQKIAPKFNKKITNQFTAYILKVATLFMLHLTKAKQKCTIMLGIIKSHVLRSVFTSPC